MRRRVSLTSVSMGCVAALVLFLSATASAQDARYIEYGFSFQPPAGWQQDAEAEGAIPARYRAAIARAAPVACGSATRSP